MNADLAIGSLAGDPFASVSQGFWQWQPARLAQDLEQGGGGAAWGILFQAMMHFHDLQIEVRPQNFHGFPRQPEQRVDARRIIRSPHDRDLGGELDDLRLFLRGMSGRSDHERLLMARAQRGHTGGDVVKTEFDDDIPLGQDCFEVVTLIHLAGDGTVGQPAGAIQQRAAHPPFITVDDDADHFRTPHAFRVALSVSRLRAPMGTSGNRYSSSQMPSMARAALTGMGLVSINKSLNSE